MAARRARGLPQPVPRSGDVRLRDNKTCARTGRPAGGGRETRPGHSGRAMAVGALAPVPGRSTPRRGRHHGQPDGHRLRGGGMDRLHNRQPANAATTLARPTPPTRLRRPGMFGFAVPAGSVVTGVTALVEGNASAGTVNYEVQLSWDGGWSWTTAKADTFTAAVRRHRHLRLDGRHLGSLLDAPRARERRVPASDLQDGRSRHAGHRPIQVAVEYTPNPVLTQGHYRWRNDDGTQTTATWTAAEDIKLVALPKATTRRLRFGVANTGAAAANVQYLLQVGFSSSCATARLRDGGVATPGQDWQILDSTNFVDGAATTDVAGGVTNGAAVFVAGQMRDASQPHGSHQPRHQPVHRDRVHAARQRLGREHGQLLLPALRPDQQPRARQLHELRPGDGRERRADAGAHRQLHRRRHERPCDQRRLPARRGDHPHRRDGLRRQRALRGDPHGDA